MKKLVTLWQSQLDESRLGANDVKQQLTVWIMPGAVLPRDYGSSG